MMKGLFMSEFESTTDKSKCLWNELADTWDERMGENNNRFHNEIIKPSTIKLLEIKENDRILDVACGNGNFSRYMAEMGVKVVAFDYSEKMIENAQIRCKDFLSQIDFRVVDATKYNEVISLGKHGLFDKAVSNMAVMDISDIQPLFKAVYELLKPGGIFVFSGIHPCFQTPGMKKLVETDDYCRNVKVRMGITAYEYINSRYHEVVAFANDEKPIIHYHRPLNELFKICFNAGFVLDGLEEPVFKKDEYRIKFDWYDIPPAIIIRLRKLNNC
jgi:2-polyprenyl-3-methyl-5-hydroxy-6-metoxy-1,4-benzoquinol methylase